MNEMIKKKILIPTLILTAVAFIAALVLSHIKEITYPSILKQEIEKQQKALDLVLPGFKPGDKMIVDVDSEKLTYWVAVKKENGIEKKGYAFITAMPGYSGDVVSMVGIDDKGTILGISVIQQTETPGLGARCTEVASSLTFFGYLLGDGMAEEDSNLPWFQEQFKGLNVNESINILKIGDWNREMREDLLKKKAITAITGATITSKAVTDSLERGRKLLYRALQLKTSETRK